MAPSTRAALLWLAAAASAQVITPAPIAPRQAADISTVETVSDCHAHGTVNWCMVGTEEYPISGPTATQEFQAEYTGCHPHGTTELFCLDESGGEVEVLIEDSGSTEEPAAEEEAAPDGQVHCHSHAGVEHCVGGSGSEEVNCDAPQRDYNTNLRIGLLFVILATSALGVFFPILVTRFTGLKTSNVFFVFLKQFGTGIILSTAFIHLYTHAVLLLGNECLGELEYEGTTAALFLAGLFVSFLIDYAGARFLESRIAKRPIPVDQEQRPGSDGKSGSSSPGPAPVIQTAGGHAHGLSRAEEKLTVLVLEAGIIFHSILIGITLVVASDQYFITLFIVIVFHQMFEGIALGSCIAQLPSAKCSTLNKLLMATAFALVTPIGMAIGIGVLKSFNGNDPTTLWAIGSLDAISAGILAWVGIVEMLAADWMHGPLLNAPVLKTGVGIFGLLAGLIVMSVLGKWA